MKWYDYILFFIIILLLIVLIIQNNNKEIIYNNIYKDTTIIKIIDTLREKEKYFLKEKIKVEYEYKIDSIYITLLPDSLLYRDIMSRAKRILQQGQFDNNRPGVGEVRKLSKDNNSSERPDTLLQSNY